MPMAAASTTVILGAGFGGIVCANALRKALPADHKVVLIEKGATFNFGAAKTWVAIGEKTASDIVTPLESLKRRGIDLVTAEVKSIDPKARAVETTSGRFKGDYMVIALGADTNMAAIPGLADVAHSFYTLDGASRLREALPKFTGGKLVLLIPRAPFKCPPGPYEGALLLHDLFKRKEMRDRVELSVVTVEGRPMATAGPEIGDFVMQELRARNIAYLTQKKTVSVSPAEKKIHFEDGSSVDFDFLIAVDPHVAPKVVTDSGLAQPGGWIPVDAKTLAVAGFDNLWAIGDVATVPLPGRFKPDAPLVLPKAGVMADAEARVVAKQIAARVQGTTSDAAFDGKGFCFIETGDMHAVKGEGSFFELPHPIMQRRVPDMMQYEEKKRWMYDWLRENLV